MCNECIYQILHEIKMIFNKSIKIDIFDAVKKSDEQLWIDIKKHNGRDTDI